MFLYIYILHIKICEALFQFSRPAVSKPLRSHELQHARPSCPSPTPGVYPNPWIAARQASLSITNSRSSLRLMAIESVMPSSHLILCRPLLLLPSIFPSIRVFSNESVFRIGGQSIGAAASASVLPMNIQDWFPLGLTALISLQSKGLSRVHSYD